VDVSSPRAISSSLAGCPTTTRLDLQLPPDAQHWLNAVLIWIGLGAVAGLLARAVLPTPWPSGPAATLALGIIGSSLGLAALSAVVGVGGFNPVSPAGILAAAAGAVALMLGLAGASYFRARRSPDASAEADE